MLKALEYDAGFHRPTGSHFDDFHLFGSDGAIVRGRCFKVDHQKPLFHLYPLQLVFCAESTPDARLREAKVIIEWWRHQYNTVRPLGALNMGRPAPEATLLAANHQSCEYQQYCGLTLDQLFQANYFHPMDLVGGRNLYA
jgi:transposase InsO family protein